MGKCQFTPKGGGYKYQMTIKTKVCLITRSYYDGSGYRGDQNSYSDLSKRGLSIESSRHSM